MIKSEKFLPWVADMPAYSLGRSYSDVVDENRVSSESLVKLASNENPYGCSPLVKKFLAGSSAAEKSLNVWMTSLIMS